uniref:Uncharacterized protein n=1 Tax=viral metagenome TaxID=1070528 RepID=A0A6M3LP09_9ZZZZ
MTDTKEMDDLEWLDKHWMMDYKGERVGEYIARQKWFIETKSIQGHIKEMRDYQEKGE